MEVFRETVNKCIQTENNSEYEINTAQIIKDVVGGHFTFHQFVESLGRYLTDGNVDQRAKGVGLLSHIILKLPANFLKEVEVHMLAVFLCERVADHESVASKTLKGLHNLLVRHWGAVTKVEIDLILRTIFGDFCTQMHAADDRRCVFLVFKTLLQSRLEELKALGFEFVSGFLQAIDGEKDPRNLITVFGLIPVVILNFDIEPFVEQLFEVTACYFPIDFSPPPNDHRGVTREDLVLGLRSCLSATPRFAQHCLPLLLEKMGSDLDSAKMDTFQTLEACSGVYGCDGLKEFYSDIWKGIRLEVFSSSNSSLENAALRALTAVVKTAWQGVVERSSQDILSRLVSDILKESVSYLIASDMNLIGPTTKLLSAVAMASISAYDLTAQAIVPLLLQHYFLAKELAQQKMLLNSMSMMLACRLQFHSPSRHKCPLSANKSALLALYCSAVDTAADPSLRLTAIDGLLSMTTIPELLAKDEIQRIGSLFAKCAVDETEESHRLACLNALAKVVELHDTNVSNAILSDALTFIDIGLEICGVQCDATGNHHQSLFDCHLRVITAAVGDSEGLMAVTPALLRQFKNAANGTSECKRNPILRCFKQLAAKQELTRTASHYWCQEILLRLMEQVVTNDCFNLLLLEAVAEVNLAAVPYLATSDSLKLLLYTMQLYLNVKFLDPGVDNRLSELPELSQSTIVYVESILNSVRMEVFTEDLQENLDQFLTKAIAQVEAVDAMEPLVRSASCAIASVLNKVPDGEYLDKIISAVFERVNIRMHQLEELQASRKQNLISLLSWVTKALVIRGHPSMEKFISEMFVGLEDESISELTASGFQLIVSDSERALNTRCHANVRLLYRQRFFLTTCPRLIAGFNTASEGTKYSFLTALVHLASCLPKEIVMSEVTSLLPLFIRGLLSDSSVLLIALLSTLSELMTDSTDFAEAYADTIIPHLLNLSTFRSSMLVRIKALSCVGHLVNLPLHVCIKHKQDVIMKLGEAIDDSKRLVRKAASTARSSWFLVGS